MKHSLAIKHEHEYVIKIITGAARSDIKLLLPQICVNCEFFTSEFLKDCFRTYFSFLKVRLYGWSH